MFELPELIAYYNKTGLFETALLLAQFQAQHDQREETRVLLLETLYHSGDHARVVEMAREDPALLKYRQVAMICAKCGVLDISPQTGTIQLTPKVTSYEIGYNSLLHFYKALTETDRLRYDSLIRSLEEDSDNTEAIILLFKDGMIRYDVFIGHIRAIKLNLIRDVLLDIFSGESNKLYNTPLTDLYLPLFTVDETRTHLKTLFKRAVYFSEHHGANEHVNLILSLFYISKKQYKEAKRRLERGLDQNSHSGMSHLYLGICCSMLRESEYALRHLDRAYLICTDSSLPAYYLACEHQGSNGFSIANYYYKIAMEYSGAFGSNYAYFLLENKRNKDAQKHAKRNTVLRVFYYLMTDRLKEAQKEMAQCSETEGLHYYLANGYLLHLVEEYDDAISNYYLAQNIRHLKVTEELISIAMESRIKNDRRNKAFTYLLALFDTLEYKNRRLFVFM
ncbi:hypothetical protein ECANGB1_1671 [Enterospora canceri]|uniref:CDC16 n=1 Tax=Enterospora canceri TaxID=1081671 RepID=A0A1Y1S979_9MICR|nr:hypothetical protein ECANGB1_1671 [Enterospora canceri]